MFGEWFLGCRLLDFVLWVGGFLVAGFCLLGGWFLGG